MSTPHRGEGLTSVVGFTQLHTYMEISPTFETDIVFRFFVSTYRCPHRAFPNYGSVLWMLIHVLLKDYGTPQQNLERIWRDITRLYGEMQVENKYWIIRMSMFNTGSQPKMKGKAAEIKDLLPVLVVVWRMYYNEAKEVERNILTVLEGSAHLDLILTRHPSDLALPGPVADDLVATCCITLSTWYGVFLHFKAEEMPVPLFGLTGKAHLLMHCCLLSRCGLSR